MYEPKLHEDVHMNQQFVWFGIYIVHKYEDLLKCTLF